MAISDNRKYSLKWVCELLEDAKGRTLGEIDRNGANIFLTTKDKPKITGIAGSIVEQSLFGYKPDNNQECDIQIDGILTELKTTGIRIPKSELKVAKTKGGTEYNKHFKAKEGISITGVTFNPYPQTNFEKSHFWEKAENLLLVFYEYTAYKPVLAAEYERFKIIDYCFNKFTQTEKNQLRSDWEKVRDFLVPVYEMYPNVEERNQHLEGFTRKLRPNLLLIELVPAFKNKKNSHSHPRYRLKKTFVDTIVKNHFCNDTKEVDLEKSFASFNELDKKCHDLSMLYSNKTFNELKVLLDIKSDVLNKDFGAKCILKMFDAQCSELKQIKDFQKAGIICRTITLSPKNRKTEDMKLDSIDFEEWTNRDVDFEESEIFNFFVEHSLLCPIFQECEITEEIKSSKEEIRGLTKFLGFKRLSFDDDFICSDVKKTWESVRRLVHTNTLIWEYVIDKDGNKKMNKSGSYAGAPNLPKSSEFNVFCRGGATDSSDKYRTEFVNGIKMLPQSFWIKGTFIVEKLNTKEYL